jgi:hypothetical protein
MAQGQFGGEVFSANRVGLLGFLGQGSPTNKCQDPHQTGAGWNSCVPQEVADHQRDRTLLCGSALENSAPGRVHQCRKLGSDHLCDLPSFNEN